MEEGRERSRKEGDLTKIWQHANKFEKSVYSALHA